MKIRTKLTIFFTTILFILVLMLSLWYQYRLFYLLRQESIRNLDMFSNNIFRPESQGRFEKNKRPPVKPEKFDRLPSEAPDRLWKKEDFNNFILKFDETQNKDDFTRIFSRHTWFALFDNNLNPIVETLFARDFPVKNLKPYLNKKYFTVKLKVNSIYFIKNKELQMFSLFSEFKLMMEQGFYTEKNNHIFHCIGKISTINIENEKFYSVVLLSENKNFEYIQNSLINTFFTLIFLIFIIILLGILYSKYSLNPINNIINDLNNISEQNLSQRIKLGKKNKDEISEISLSINNLLKRIENAFNMEKQFISDVSHEFKTPISILQLNLESLANNPNLSDEEIDNITTSLEILYSLNFLIQKLLYLSRLESNLCPFKPKMINIKDILNSIKNNIQNIALSKNLKLFLNIKNKKLKINGDKELLYIALYNVIENSLKYTDKGHVIINADKTDGKIRIIIEDTGIGIPKDKINKIFDKFYRADSSRNDNRSFGIGLTITKRILDIHHAIINIESIENVKTRFIIDFKNNII